MYLYVSDIFSSCSSINPNQLISFIRSEGIPHPFIYCFILSENYTFPHLKTIAAVSHSKALLNSFLITVRPKSPSSQLQV